MTSEPIADVLDRALDALGALETRGLEVEEEWQYVTDLAAAWRSRLATVRAARGDEAAAGVAGAVDEAIVETTLIEDPHRAIDWLSTFPQVVLAALGERT